MIPNEYPEASNIPNSSIKILVDKFEKTRQGTQKNDDTGEKGLVFTPCCVERVNYIYTLLLAVTSNTLQLPDDFPRRFHSLSTVRAKCPFE